MKNVPLLLTPLRTWSGFQRCSCEGWRWTGKFTGSGTGPFCRRRSVFRESWIWQDSGCRGIGERPSLDRSSSKTGSGSWCGQTARSFRPTGQIAPDSTPGGTGGRVAYVSGQVVWQGRGIPPMPIRFDSLNFPHRSGVLGN